MTYSEESGIESDRRWRAALNIESDGPVPESRPLRSRRDREQRAIQSVLTGLKNAVRCLRGGLILAGFTLFCSAEAARDLVRGKATTFQTFLSDCRFLARQIRQSGIQELAQR